MSNRNNMIPIPGRLHSVAVGEPVSGADEVLDDALNMEQSEINQLTVGTKNASTGTTGAYPYNGMGRVVLHKNMVNGVNTLTQDMLYKGDPGSRVPNTNTIFVIQYDFVLGEDITVPADCVLEFDGGSISGEHTITFNKTELISPKFVNVTFAGTIKNHSVSAIGMGLDNTGTNDNSDILLSLLLILPLSGTELVFEGGTYNIVKRITVPNTQNPFFLSGSGSQSTIIKATNANAGITFTNLLRSTIKDLHFDAGTFDRSTPFVNVDNGVGIINVTTFHKCSFIGNKAFYSMFGGYCRFDECTARISNPLATDEYCIKLSGEYYYFNNCYIGETTFVGNNFPSILYLDRASYVYIQNSDFCNTINGNAIKLKGCQHIFVKDTAMMRDTRLFDFDHSVAIIDVDIKISIFDNKVIDKIIYAHKDSGTYGNLSNIKGLFFITGAAKNIETFDGPAINISSYNNCRFKYIYPYGYDITYPTSKDVILFYENSGYSGVITGTPSGDTPVLKILLSHKSPYTDITLPKASFSLFSGRPIEEYSFENTFGGDCYLVVKTNGNLWTNSSYYLYDDFR